MKKYRKKPGCFLKETSVKLRREHKQKIAMRVINKILQNKGYINSVRQLQREIYTEGNI